MNMVVQLKRLTAILEAHVQHASNIEGEVKTTEALEKTVAAVQREVKR